MSLTTLVNRRAAVAKQIAMADVEDELARRPLLKLVFPPALETCYDAEMKAARVWTIRLTLTLGLVAYNIFTLTDREILPDLGWLPCLWRLCIVTPIALFAMWKCTDFSAPLRELYMALLVLGAMIGPVAFMLMSEAQYAPYTMLIVVLTSMFGNITIRLRFDWAAFFTLLSVVWVGFLLCLKPNLSFILSLHLFLTNVVCVIFGLVGNNQLERADRHGFLLALKERMRSDQLSVETAKLSTLTQVDALTGLANRRAFDVKLADLWRSRQENDIPFSLLMIDVDFFKRYNDYYGHPIGDECLVKVGAEIRAFATRDDDLVARYGGEEFAVLLTDCKAKTALEIAEKICFGIRRAAIVHANREDDDQVVTISIGVAASNEDGVKSVTELLARADKHLYEAKRRGRNTVFSADAVSESCPQLQTFVI